MKMKLTTGYERLQSPEDRDKLDGLYECILCACMLFNKLSVFGGIQKICWSCSIIAKHIGLLQTQEMKEKKLRLKKLNDAFSVYRCHGIMNCISMSERIKSF